jgi:type I restriction enzyme M protein
MAIVEKVGKDRRGVPIYKKDDDGADLLYDNVKKWITVNEYGVEQIHSRKERIKLIDDDLPVVSMAYKKYLEDQEDILTFYL